jgi:glycosyltransferase involved in cell wall biosynthesis
MRNMGFWLDNWLKRACFRFVNRRVIDVMLTNSESAKVWLVSNSLCPEDKIAVIKNGISLEAVRGSQSPDSLKAELGVDEGPVVGTVAKLRPVKGVRYFIEAAAMIHARHPSVKFLVVGDGSERERLRSLASRLGLNGHIILAGARDDARDLLGLLDVFVLPSLSEGMPWAVLEAMAVGLPVVATRVGGVPELVDDGRTGYLVEPRDAESISDSVCKLIDDPDAMRQLGSAGRKRAKTEFALDKMRRDTEELYVRLMEARDIVQ